MYFLKYQHDLKFRCIAWLAVLAIILPVGAPLFHSTPRAATRAGVRLHICSADKTTDAGGKPTHEKLPPCPICQSLHFLNGGFVPPHDVAAVAVFFSIAPVRHIPDQAVTPAQTAAIAWPRAPPFSSQAS